MVVHDREDGWDTCRQRSCAYGCSCPHGEVCDLRRPQRRWFELELGAEFHGTVVDDKNTPLTGL